MANIVLSGVLKGPTGKPLPYAELTLRSIITTTDVIGQSEYVTTLDSDGSYTLAIQHGAYDIFARFDTREIALARAVRIDATTSANTLNQLIVDRQGEDDITPAVILEFRKLTTEARRHRNAAKASADAAAGSASAAATSKNQANTAKNQAQTASGDAAESEKAAKDAASAAAQSEKNAKGSEATAKQKATAADASASAAATSRNQANTAKNQAQTAAGNAAASEKAAADSETAAAKWAGNAASSAASVEAQEIVHRPGSGLPNEAGDIYSRNAAEFVSSSGGVMENGRLNKYIRFSDFDDPISEGTGIKSFVRDGLWRLYGDDNEQNNVEMELSGRRVWHGGSFDPSTKKGRRNFLINGCFRVDQRFSNIFPVSNSFVIDRWRIRGTAASGGSGVIGLVTGNPNWSPSGTYLHLGPKGMDETYIYQRVEAPVELIGQTVTASIRTGFDATAQMKVSFSLYDGGGTKLFDISSDLKDVRNGVVSWTMMLPKVGGTLSDGSYLNVIFSIIGVEDRGYRLSMAKLEIGDSATPFEARPIAEEIILCQRYYYCPSRSTLFMGHLNLINATGVIRRLYVRFPVKMRDRPRISLEVSPNTGTVSNVGVQGTTQESTQIMASVSDVGAYVSLNYLEADAEL